MADIRNSGPAGLNLLGAADAAGRIARGEISSERLVADCLARIAAREPRIHAWDHLDPEAALAQARARDAEAPRGPLHGVPVGIKDIFDTHDMPTRYGSALYEGHRPPADSACVALLRLAGAVMLGKTATTEFASPQLLATRNPHDPARSPGVSSSGSAAAVADYMVPLAIGSQTGGSTTLPAAFCGVVGYKAGMTALDRGGLRHLRPTIDALGLFARSVEDIVLMRAALTGGAAREPVPEPRALRVAVCRTPWWDKAGPESAGAFETTLAALARSGAPLAEPAMDDVFDGLEEAFGVIVNVEGRRAMDEEFRRGLAGMNRWLRAGFEAGERLTHAEYDAAQAAAIGCRRALARLFEDHDVVVTPAARGEAPADLVSIADSAFNRLWSLLHGPCVVLPVSSGPNGMPVGVQLVGPIGADDRLLAIARRVEGALGLA